jgi:type III restriction enzyme
MAKHTRQIDQLIINSPFAEPAEYWKYDRTHLLFTRMEGRRPAGYVMASPESSKGFDDPGIFVELELANRIRPRVKAWRENDYPGVTSLTRDLLSHWCDVEEREGNRFFYCQLEAIETLIWLTEADPAERQGIEVPSDGGPFSRWCTKLATGTGKTVVMAMLIAWQILNKVCYPQDRRFSKNTLVIAPGLTVRSRLSVLVPDAPGNYYDQFSILPTGLYEPLRQGKVLVRNWHALDWESDVQLAKRRSVDKRGAKSDEAYVRDVLGDLAAARNLLVINDEAHHAWRVPAGQKVAGVSREDVDEATKWIGGLDRIHRARGILQCCDFSATPFVPTGKKSSEDALFGWIVSDFGLNDAIEAGLVKTPRVVVRDDGTLSADYKSRFYHLYTDDEVRDDVNRKAEEHEPLPDLVTKGYYFLGKDWLETAKEWSAVGHPTPPVIITVANRTETAARIKFAFDHERILLKELCVPDRTLHIDSKTLEEAEEAEEPVALVPVASSDGEDGDEAPIERKKTKRQFAEELRERVNTVGQVGKSGEQVQNVISVGMLSEGWDAKTVTHIMGLRAFSSQLLCEQVVGRGLRRRSYDVNQQTGLFEPEYVNVFGVPFTFMPHEGGDDAPPPPTKPRTRVEPLPERETRYGITWPNIIRIEHVYTTELEITPANVDQLRLYAGDTPLLAELAPVIAGKPDLSKVSEIELAALGREYRLQRLTFEAARAVYEQMQPKWKGAKEYLLAQVVRIVEKILKSDRIIIEPPLFGRDELRRRVILAMNMTKIVQHIWEHIRFENTTRLEPVFDRRRPIAATSDMRPWDTVRPAQTTRRSHINVCVYDSTWEASEAFVLEKSNVVDAWVKNDHLGFEVMYVHGGVVRKFRPDFLIRLANGTMLVLEIKGEDSAQNQSKRHFLNEWVRAVNAHGGFGHWAWDVSYDPKDVEGILTKHSGK